MNNPQDPKEQEIRSPMPPNNVSEDTQNTDTPPAEETADSKKADSRNRAKKLLLALVLALGILLLLNLIPFDQLAKAAADELPEETEPIVTYSDEFFVPPDYNEDVSADEIYQKYNRLLTYTRDGESFAVTADTAEGHGAVCVLFQTYMEALMAGDSETCNSLFTQEYLEEKGKFSFAPQKVYDMEAKVIRSAVLVDGDVNGEYKGYTVYYCEVSYKLRQNNGTLRKDFYREGDSLPQIFEVLEKDNVAKINEISAIRSGIPQSPATKGESILMYVIWIAVIAIAIGIEATTATLTAIWFMPGALVSLILALCNIPWQIQVPVFMILSLILVLIGMTVIRKRLLKKKHVPTNADRLIGTTGIVTEGINNIAATGEVKTDGKRWSARSEDGSLIEEGTVVTILRIEGVKLIVEKK